MFAFCWLFYKTFVLSGKVITMNKTYKTVFNYHTQTWTAVSEIASARGKSKKNHLKLSVAIASSLLGLVSMNAYADTTLTCTTSATDTTGNVICGNSAAANAASAISIGSSANAVTRNSIAIGNSSNTAVTTAVICPRIDGHLLT